MTGAIQASSPYEAAAAVVAGVPASAVGAAVSPFEEGFGEIGMPGEGAGAACRIGFFPFAR